MTTYLQIHHRFQEWLIEWEQAYQMKIKLRHAIQDIQTTADEIKEIASRFGYSQPWFCSWIKRETGKTPSALRKNARR